MKDMGERFGSSAWAVPVVVSGDTVYVHTDIKQVTENVEGEPTTDLWEYQEVQYSVTEYIELIGRENKELNNLMNIVLGVSE